MHPVTLITGGSRGIGLAIAERLAREGHKLINLSRSQPAQGPFEDSYPADLSNDESLRSCLAEICAKHSIDNVVNNAALADIAELDSITMEDVDRMVDLNLKAVILVTQALVPGMRARKRGRIVNIGSRAALGKSGRSIYGATKGALVAMSRTWALEFARHGITVNVVAPGPVATDMFFKDNPPGNPATESLLAAIPLGRIGTPADVAGAVNFLFSEDASFITGQTLYVCGGLSIGSAPML